MTACAAPEEPDLALIGRPQLPQPPGGEVMLALRTLDGDCGQRPDRFLLLNDDDLLFAPFSGFLELILVGNLPDVPAFPALQLAAGRYHQALALGTEHWLLMRPHA